LNAPDFAAVLQNTVVPAPAAEGSDFLSRFYPHIGLDSLLKRHEKTSPNGFCLLIRGNENLPKGYENNRKLSSEIFVKLADFFDEIPMARLQNKIYNGAGPDLLIPGASGMWGMDFERAEAKMIELK